MRKLIHIRKVLLLNRYQKRYLLHHLQQAQIIYVHMCKLIMKRNQIHIKCSKHNIYTLMYQYHQDFMRQLEEAELHDFLLQLMRFQESLSHAKGKAVAYHCHIENPELIWRKISLSTFLKKKCFFHTQQFYYATLSYQHPLFYLDIYLVKSNHEKKK